MIVCSLHTPLQQLDMSGVLLLPPPPDPPHPPACSRRGLYGGRRHEGNEVPADAMETLQAAEDAAAAAAEKEAAQGGASASRAARRTTRSRTAAAAGQGGGEEAGGRTLLPIMCRTGEGLAEEVSRERERNTAAGRTPKLAKAGTWGLPLPLPGVLRGTGWLACGAVRVTQMGHPNTFASWWVACVRACVRTCVQEPCAVGCILALMYAVSRRVHMYIQAISPPAMPSHAPCWLASSALPGSLLRAIAGGFAPW